MFAHRLVSRVAASAFRRSLSSSSSAVAVTSAVARPLASAVSLLRASRMSASASLSATPAAPVNVVVRGMASNSDPTPVERALTDFTTEIEDVSYHMGSLGNSAVRVFQGSSGGALAWTGCRADGLSKYFLTATHQRKAHSPLTLAADCFCPMFSPSTQT